MKTILITTLLTATLSAQSTCNFAIGHMNSELDGIRISFQDNDKWGVRSSRDSFKYWSKFAITKCPQSKADEIRELRRDTLEKIKNAGI